MTRLSVFYSFKMFVILSLLQKGEKSTELDTMLIYGLPRKAFALLAMTAEFVILSVATQRVARRKPQQKNP